jgi:DNA-directed RNA polymerase subunit RPC12/RpoP
MALENGQPSDSRVTDDFRCPYCGEDNSDRLVFLDDDCEQIRCVTCGRAYVLGDDEGSNDDR